MRFQFVCIEERYSGLAKNAAQWVTLITLGNLGPASKRGLERTPGFVRMQCGPMPKPRLITQ